jgi:hypothetical protein
MSYRPLVTTMHRHLFRQKSEQSSTYFPDIRLPEAQPKNMGEQANIPDNSAPRPERTTKPARPQTRKNQRYAPM